MEVSKQYLNGYLNADDDANGVQPNQVINAENFRFDKDGRWVSIPSNAVIANLLIPDGTNYCIGQVANEAGRYTVYFNYNNSNNPDIPNGHNIFLYYIPDGTFWTIMAGSDLNFSKDKLITARIINDILYWTDDLNEPRRVNLGAAIKFNIDPSTGRTSPIASSWQFTNTIDLYDYTIIRRPPCLTGTIAKEYDSAFNNNFIANVSVQFAYRYIYYDGEKSVLSLYTTASKLNALTDNFNRISVTLNGSEVIGQSVKTVQLIVRFGGDVEGSYGGAFVVKEWGRDDIDLHNAGTTVLNYKFYNALLGEPVSDTDAVKPFDSVPLLSGCLEVSENRLFLANNLEGYSAPSTTSLEVSMASSGESGEISGINKLLISVQAQEVPTIFNPAGDAWYYKAWWIEDTEGFMPQGKGFYELTAYAHEVRGPFLSTTPPTLDPPPTSIAYTGLTYLGSTIYNIALQNRQPSDLRGPTSEDHHNFSETSNRTTNVVNITGFTTQTVNVFKSSAQYQLGVVFYDKALRKCGVVTKDGAIASLPPRAYDFSGGITSIDWALSNTDALTEIPDWAYYYSIVMTKNLRTRFFVQGFADVVRYATKDIDGNYVYTSTTFGPAVAGISIDASALLQNNLGYVFTEGDVCILIDSANVQYQLPIIAQEGKYVIVGSKDIGSLASKTFMYELYTPYKTSSQEPFYEMGQVFAITGAGTSARAYSQIFGSFSPDAFSITRSYSSTTYYAEAMCPNDKFWQRWDTDHGRINIITSAEQKRKPTSISFSNTIIIGTQTNGLSEFDALNQTALPIELGAVRSLVNVSRIGDNEGSVMVAIGKGGCRTASIYVGITQVQNADSTNYFIKAEGVIGQVNMLKGDYGTNNPESVIVYNGNAYWFDSTKGRFIEYSVNGLDDISEGDNGTFKFARPSALLGSKLLSTLAATIESYGSRPFIFGGVDTEHKELYWSIPKLDTVVPKGQLSDYATKPDYVDSADYPYDIADYKAKTLVFCLKSAKWQGAFSWTPEGFVNVGNKVFSFKNGQLFQHGASGYNNFYGVQYRSKIMFVCNAGNTVKEFKSIALECGAAPEWVHIRSEFPYEQSTDLISSDFDQKEGVFYADILRDRLSPIAGTTEQKQISGYLMREKAVRILIQFSGSSWLRLVTVGYNQSTGHY